MGLHVRFLVWVVGSTDRLGAVGSAGGVNLGGHLHPEQDSCGHAGAQTGQLGQMAHLVPSRPDYVGVALPFEFVMAPIPKNLPAFMDWPVAGEDAALDAVALQASEDPNAASESQIAEIVPTGARAILGLVEDRGFSPEELCRGLGFTYRDLSMRDVRLSYRQMRQLFMRAERLLGEPALGLALGARQTPSSWGVPGLAMLTCETYGDALTRWEGK
ncbi:hypothetical protein G6F59_013824 [Rhizopus arrhizus]|nr:hypothetical protein G6F59_013824 [Rhizopus arrhizus]